MIEVSDAWKETNKKSFLPESFVEITLSVMDVDAAGSVSCTNEITFSKSNKVINQRDYETYKWISLEHNLWVLGDGHLAATNFTVNPPPGFVSENDEEATLSVTLTNTPVEIPGFTITWSSEYGTYATSFTLDVKKDGITVGTVTITDNTSNISEVNLPASDYDSIVLTIHEWSLPEQRRRVDSIMFGQEVVFGKNEILEYSHEQSGDPLGAELTKSVIGFSIDNSDGKWNILNQDGMMRYLCERQPVSVRYGLSVNDAVEWVDIGSFYLSEWKAQSDGIAMNFVAQDVIGLLLNALYSRTMRDASVYYSTIDIYDSKGNVTGTLAHETKFKIYGALDENGYYYTDVGYVKPEGIAIDSNLYIDVQKAIWSAASVGLTYATYLKQCPAYPTVDSEYVGEFVQKCLFSHGYTMWFDQKKKYLHLSSPVNTLSDYVIPLELSYVHPEVELTRSLESLTITAYNVESGNSQTQRFVNSGVKNGDHISVDCPYQEPAFNWGSDAATSLLWGKYQKWWGYREKVSGEFRADPRLELFDVVTVETKHGSVSPVMITYLKYTYNGSFRANYEGKTCGNLNVATVEE